LCVHCPIFSVNKNKDMTKTMLLPRWILFLSHFTAVVSSFVLYPPYGHKQQLCRLSAASQTQLGLGEYAVILSKPLGMILEEREGGGGVCVKEVSKENGNAWNTEIVAPGDVLLTINQQDVSNADFDAVMDLLAAAEDPVSLTLGDGLGQLDMPRNVAAQLKTSEDAFLIDAVVRQAARELRRDGRLRALLGVEVVVGAGVQMNGELGSARFFAIFSTDGVTSYSCNVSAAGVRVGDVDDISSSPQVKIRSLSCAKEEGLGRTYDLITEIDA
jgi:hypothetical protein